MLLIISVNITSFVTRTGINISPQNNCWVKLEYSIFLTLSNAVMIMATSRLCCGSGKLLMQKLDFANYLQFLNIHWVKLVNTVEKRYQTILG